MVRLLPRLLPQTAVLPLVATTACDGTDPVPVAPAFITRDSADIQIVENHAPEWGDGGSWTVAAEPTMVIGGYRSAGEPTDSSHLVWSVADVGRLSDGRVAVLSSKEKTLFVFEPSGEFVRSIGREGRGPGEFGYPEHLQILSGDTLVVWDYMLGPVAYFDPSGRLHRDWRIDVGALFAVLRKRNLRPSERVHLPLQDESFILQISLIPQDFMLPVGVPYRAPREFIRVDSAYGVYTFGRWEDKSISTKRGFSRSSRSRSASNWQPDRTLHRCTSAAATDTKCTNSLSVGHLFA